jgi:DNA-binding NarL/FixJ family response regulator
MMAMIRYLFAALFIVITTLSFSQGVTMTAMDKPWKNYKPEFRRLINHEAIDREQKLILESAGNTRDSIFRISTNEEVNFLVTEALINKVDWLQYKIEKDTVLDHRRKVLYLKGIENLLRFYRKNWRSKTVNAAELPGILEAYQKCMQLDIGGKTIEPVINGLSYGAGTTVLAAEIFHKNPGFTGSHYELMRKYCSQHPEKILATLKENMDLPFADSLIRIAAYKYPNMLYNYAAAGDQFGYTIRKQDDPLIRTISRMASSNSGRLYFPFLDNIAKGRMSFAEVDAAKDDSVKYYKLLVKTHLDYLERALNKDTAYGSNELTGMLAKKAVEIFVNTINGLHEVENPAIRFKCIQPLDAAELYYLAVLTDGVIYTSSFVNGVYPLMMNRINHRSDSLLMTVKFDRYRKFVKMCAAYNTLGNFLSSFPNTGDPKKLMQAFVSGLEKTKGLEDGVDVADSYASIVESNKQVADQMVTNIKYNYQRNLAQNNKKGMVMYDLLYKLFLSADTTKNIDLSKELGIPPVYNVDYKSLVDDSDRIIQQVFFYGDEDKDGQNSYANFLALFRNKTEWIITDNNPYWIWIRSVSGKRIWIFANKPLYGDDDPDARAQEKLDEYLKEKNLKPTIFIHRGHSFHVNSSLAQLQPSARIVILGSCGGYNNLKDVLSVSPDAHIISSKQTGTKTVNEPILQAINNTIRGGRNIDWIPLWKDLSKKFSGEAKEKFDDYIPPFKNLGALFIKAYKIAMGNLGEED